MCSAAVNVIKMMDRKLIKKLSHKLSQLLKKKKQMF